MSGLSRWKMLDNLRRSLVPIATLAWLVAGWTVLPGSPMKWTLVVLIVFALRWLLAPLPGRDATAAQAVVAAVLSRPVA